MKTLQITRQSLVALSVTFAAGLLFTNVYNSIVDAPNWGSNLPTSIETARSYFGTRDPGSFYRVASPINQVISLLALASCWKAGGRVRLWCGAALLISVLSDMFTFAYFFPRNDIMFGAPIRTSIEMIRQAHSQWSFMNWVRSAGVALNVVAGFGALFSLLGVQRIKSEKQSSPLSLESAA